MWKARNSSSRYAMRFLVFLDVRIIYIIIISWGCMMYDGHPSPWYVLVHGLSDSVHNYVGMAMVLRRAATAALGWFRRRLLMCVLFDDVRSMIRWCGFYIPRQRIGIDAHVPTVLDCRCNPMYRCVGWMDVYHLFDDVNFVADGNGWCTWCVLSSMFAIFCRRGTEFYFIWWGSAAPGATDNSLSLLDS